MIGTILVVLIVISWLFWLAAWYFSWEFFNKRQQSVPGFAPPVSILKPVKGMDPDLYGCLRSFLDQDYPEFEVLLGVESIADPAANVLARIEREYPERVRLIVADSIGLNSKASTLHALALHASYPILIVSDSDMHATPDYLQRVVAPLNNPDVGMVICPYVGDKPLTLTARLESLYIGTTFLPMVMVARRYLRTRFALGSTAVFWASELERIGGFKGITDYLADDYELGHRISGLGLRVYMSDYVMRTVLGHTTFSEQWNREVRWMRCSRVSRPIEYPAVLVTLATPLSLLWLIGSGFATIPALALLITLILRWASAWEVTGYTGDEVSRQSLTLLPLRDLLTAAVWMAGLFRTTVRWRGSEFSLTRDGRLIPPRPSWLRRLLHPQREDAP